MRRLVIAMLAALALACGVAISGRVEVGDDVGRPPAATPCPQAIE